MAQGMDLQQANTMDIILSVMQAMGYDDFIYVQIIYKVMISYDQYNESIPWIHNIGI